MPEISVVMITYNQEDYISQAIQSVLNQTFSDFELIIVNDGSSDRTGDIIQTFQDKRIIYIYQENQGPNAAYNRGICIAKGRFICFLPADDLYFPQKLEQQYEFMINSDYRISFSWVEFIDEEGQPITTSHFADSYFNHPNRSQAEILNWFFFKGNYLSLSTIIAQRELFDDVGIFQLTSIQLSDFEMYIRLINKMELVIIEEPLLKYRIRSGEMNVSSLSNYVRIYFETYLIYRQIFDTTPPELFRQAFVSYLRKPDFEAGPEYELEKAFLYLEHDIASIRTIAGEKLFQLLQDPLTLTIATKEYKFGLPQLYALNKEMDISNSMSYKKLEGWALALEKDRDQLANQYQESQEEIRGLQQTLNQFIQDLRNLQATRTVRLARAASLLGIRLRNLASDLLSKETIRGNVDHIEINAQGQLKLVGWVISKKGTVKKIETWLGRELLGTAQYGIERPDILASKPWIKPPNCGYMGLYTLDPNQLGKHSLNLSVKVQDTLGNKREYSAGTLRIINAE